MEACIDRSPVIVLVLSFIGWLRCLGWFLIIADLRSLNLNYMQILFMQKKEKKNLQKQDTMCLAIVSLHISVRVFSRNNPLLSFVARAYLRDVLQGDFDCVSVKGK